jgi:tRNA threonylcarbamoyladenosine biosynthesis protein TsaE
VTSPTFALAHEYRGGRLPVFHFDFYRIGTEDELLALGWDEYLEQDAVIVAEWADKFPRCLPVEAIWLEFRLLADGSREVFNR